MTRKQAIATANLLTHNGQSVYVFREGNNWYLAEGNAQPANSSSDAFYRCAKAF